MLDTYVKWDDYMEIASEKVEQGKLAAEYVGNAFSRRDAEEARSNKRVKTAQAAFAASSYSSADEHSNSSSSSTELLEAVDYVERVAEMRRRDERFRARTMALLAAHFGRANLQHVEL